MGSFWDRLGGVVVRRHRRLVAAALVTAVVLGVGVTGLAFDTGEDMLVDPGSQAYKDNRRYQARFGGESMFVLISGDITRLVEGDNLKALTAIESELRATGRFHSVLGPVTALGFARDQLTVAPGMLAAASAREQAAAADAARADAVAKGATPEVAAAAAAKAADVVKISYDQQLQTELGRVGAAGETVLENPAFVRFLLFEPDGRTIRPILRDNFLDRHHALLIVRLEGNAAIGDLGAGSDAVKEIVDRHPIAGAEIVTTGPPTLLQEINDYLRGGMTALGALAVGVMVAVLWLVFRARWRLLSLAVVVLGSLWAFGIMGLIGIPLTMVTISGFPILIGMGVDFAIQMHNRFEEELHRGADGAEAARRSMRHMAPPLAVAMVAAAVGFLALQISRVPMIRDFGLMLSIGVVALVVGAIAVPTSVLMWRERVRPTPPARAGLRGGVLERGVLAMTHVAQRWILPLSLAGVAIVGAGLAVEGRFTIQTDPERWVAEDSDAVRELEALRDGTHFSTELGFLVEAHDVTTTEVASWMQSYASRQMERHGDELVRFTSMPAIAESVTASRPTADDMEAVLSVAPPDVTAAFVSPDRSEANIIFPIPSLPLERRDALIQEMQADLDPPEGVTVTPAGLVVSGIELVNGLEANRLGMTLLAMAAVFTWLLLFFRGLTRAVLPLIPVLMAVGASSLVIYLLGFELTPLTTVTGPLVIAVTTEFSVLILVRYIEERERGRLPTEAVDEGVARIGRAFVASGLTLMAGFAVLASSPMPLLRDFGVVVAINVVVALVCALVLLPPLLVWADRSPLIRGFCPGPRPLADTPAPECVDRELTRV